MKHTRVRLNRNMHILLIHQAFTTLDEAGGTRHAELALYLAKNGHQVTIIASPVSYLSGKSSTRQRWSVKTTPAPNLTIYRCYTYHGLHRSFVHRVISFLSFMLSSFLTSLKVRNVDVVWGTSPPIFQGATAWLVARLKGSSFLFEVRDLWPAFAIAIGVLRNKTLIRTSEWLEAFLYRHADQVVINSPGFDEHVKLRGARHVTLIPNSVDADMFVVHPERSNSRKKYGLKNEFVVMYAGAHGLSNDLGVVLDAAEILLDDKKIRFLLVGDGKEKPSLMICAAERGLSNVLFLPPQPKQTMPVLLAAADAGLAILKPLELYKTTYPNKVFDYMAAGKPVILVIDGVIRQVVEAAKCGVFVKPGDASELASVIRDLARDPSQCKTMGVSGSQYVRKHFDRKDIARSFQELLEKMRLHG
jgi:glycosyltransferase involved in cell wall biosynthesis